jgi:hypothetical protein
MFENEFSSLFSVQMNKQRKIRRKKIENQQQAYALNARTKGESEATLSE